jgi:hypothetical protein
VVGYDAEEEVLCTLAEDDQGDLRSYFEDISPVLYDVDEMPSIAVSCSLY